MSHRSSLTHGALLIAGTSIGGGMLALPVITGQVGFAPSLLIYFLCWAFMTCTGLLFLEVNQWTHSEANIVSMANATLGKFGKYAAWGLYLFLFYCLTLAYVVGCGEMLVGLFPAFGSAINGSILFVLLSAPIVYAGYKWVGRVNSLLMVGLVVSFCLFVFLGVKHIDLSYLKRSNWAHAAATLPVCFTAFAYQGTIPSLVNYFKGDLNLSRKAILIGTSMPFVIYIIWQALILGIVPLDGAGGLKEALELGQNAVQPLERFIGDANEGSVWLMVAGRAFAFFALVTSFLGVTVGLMDFLADSLKIEKTPLNKIWLSLLIFLPPLLLSANYQHLFLTALEVAGGIGCALLLGLLPIMMVISGRYFLKMKGEESIRGGKLVLAALTLFVLFEVFVEISHQFL